MYNVIAYVRNSVIFIFLDVANSDDGENKYANTGISMFAQWINRGIWLFLISLPGYTELVTDFSELVNNHCT